MLDSIIQLSLRNKLIILLFTFFIVAFGTYSLLNISIGAVPDVTNNQVQVITTSRNLSTQDIEQFITYPVELEMANLPGVKEIRSISRFGLSVVTIVFEDELGTYLPRQLIAEKIKSAAANIPHEFGAPEMGPITTGLGEIYQYVLEVAPEYETRYSTMELRTIQDWIIKRQLSGIPGVVEVNTWGGHLKQYEVALNPDRLRAMNLSVASIFDALEQNNSVVGGGYIEKEDQAYFIRGEGLTKQLSDIENIIITKREGIPIFIKDIAQVGFGSATRFGAITGNGEGEKVLGQVMMLKHANSKEVIEAVKERVLQIQSSLPPGVSINPFLERSELIDKTTGTITENLVLGCLIVVFVVVLLLGDPRTAWVVASIIPLSLLFALSLMYVTGVDANLMSLGAIDFGIIIDGTVIIVEYIAYQITSRQSELMGMPITERRSMMDRITGSGASKMMNSAIFGQLIIIIVFIPILSLGGIEGKLFRPMAFTFVFALLGAMLLCFTYVPVISSLLLRPKHASKITLSERLIYWLQSVYHPVLQWALNHTKVVLSLAMAALLGAFVLFSSLGGEFVPTLDEGDFVIQPVIKTGTSLSRTVELTTHMEQVIKQFPEVEQVVTRIGAAEVPTDPMSMEETDVIITLKPKREWVTTKSKDDLANLIKQRLAAEIAGVDYEITQPIEMRFNELITGVRADLAIKIFGDDLKILAEKGAEIERLIEDIDGASDVVVEKVEGLPQMSVTYDRQKIARYGLNVSEVNDVLLMGFAGKKAGSIFEGERRFDLVVRFDPEFRKDIHHLAETYVPIPSGGQVPLGELASIEYTTGPAQISRDDTRRRIVVSVNVRNRDLESVVNDARSLIEAHVQLPPGYMITYGGQFENLRDARERLAYAVPIALFLIFIMLYFAFRSVSKALMVYTAIPLAAVGGVLSLWLRGLPFSISAGVGFIALFGIAVLNGIVLIEHFKVLKLQDFTGLKQLIIGGSSQRLRPVLLTAATDALGFLPMAISTSPGAEVQRPLATVVIGGLITATLLTLVVLPVLYYLLNKHTLKLRVNAKVMVGCLLLFAGGATLGQPRSLTLDEAIQVATENNVELRAQQLAVDRQAALLGTAFSFDKATVYYHYDENNIAPNGLPLRVWGVRQSIQFPTVYSQQKKRQQSLLEQHQYRLSMARRKLAEEVSKVYYELGYLHNLEERYQFLDSTYNRFAQAADRRLELGEANRLEKLTAASTQNNVALKLEAVKKSKEKAYVRLNQLLQQEDSVFISPTALKKLEVTVPDTMAHPGISYYNQRIQSVSHQQKIKQRQLLPDVQLEYFRGTNTGFEPRIYNGVQVGIGIPILFRGQQAEIKASQFAYRQVAMEAESYRLRLKSALAERMIELEQQEVGLARFDQYGRELAEELLRVATRSFRSGEIDFFQYIQTIDRGVQLQVDYLERLRKYNETVLEINYLTIE